MSFDIVKTQFSKEEFWYVEIDVDATTYRFCQNVSPLPAGLDAIPSLTGAPNTSPAVVNLSGGTGLRASATFSIRNHEDYTIFGTATNPKRFWQVWRANHPYYKGSPCRIYSGYIVDGVYNPANFQERNYVIETFGFSKGVAAFNVKDPLKFADNKRTKVPAVSTGRLAAPITDTDTSATLEPVGVGDDEYPASGFIRIRSEVVSFTRVSDTLTITRGQYNTVGEAHSQGDTCQLCVEYNDTVDDILYDLLVNYADIDAAFIDTAAWAAERSTFLPGLYATLITEPVGVETLLKELGEQAPHFLYWDERISRIQFIAIKEPPENVTALTDEANILEGSVSVVDMPDMRLSTIIVNFGQFDPTKKLDEFNNYQQSYIRIDTDSVSNYGSQSIKQINSRWLISNNNAGARLLAARLGRRFSDAPRQITFSMDAKDSFFWTGDNCGLNTWDIVNASGDRYTVPAQIISAKQSQNYNYTAIEYLYGPSLPQDEDADSIGKTVILSGEITDINLRTVFDSLFPSFDPDDDIKFIFDLSCVAGSTSTSAAVDTGTWAGLNNPIIIDVRGLLLGKGGNGADFRTDNAEDGGLALNMSDDIRLDNSGIIGGGGGGGGYSRSFEPGLEGDAAGGGGAGYLVGNGGFGTSAGLGIPVVQAQDGSFTTGGDGGISTENGGDGGDLGQSGEDGTIPTGSAGGLAGAAIQTNGNTITYINAGDIRGAIT